VLIATDHWSEVTAIATCVLAAGVIVAVWGVWETRTAAQSDLTATREAATAAEAAARRQIEASYRPLLIEVLRHGPIGPDMEAFENPTPSHRAILPKIIDISVGALTRSIDPRAVHVEGANGVAYVSVPLRNVGLGLAELHEGTIGVWLEGAEVHDTSVKRARVPPGETTRVSCSLTIGDTSDLSRFSIQVPYWDLAGGQGAAAAVYLRQTSADTWEVEDVEQLPENPRPTHEPEDHDAGQAFFTPRTRGL
jgi:hypothetical protein